ncbi:MAG: CU044_2847 family protein [Cyanobacteria bacterium J06621_8]
MKKLTPIELEDGTVIYMEVQEDIELVSEESTGEVTRGDLGRGEKGRGGATRSPQEQIRQSFTAIEGTIRTYTNHTLNAFRQVGSGNIDKVTLEFGIKVGGKAGIPYVTEGSADSHLKIVVECSFPNESAENNS